MPGTWRIDREAGLAIAYAMQHCPQLTPTEWSKVMSDERAREDPDLAAELRDARQDARHVAEERDELDAQGERLRRSLRQRDQTIRLLREDLAVARALRLRFGLLREIHDAAN